MFESIYSEVNNRFIKFLVIISLLELEEKEKIEEILDNEDNLNDFVVTYKRVKNSKSPS